jgi:hypothetical protein
MRANVLGVVMATAMAAPAAAQERGDVGVTMGYPAALGVVWHVTDRVALRPDVSLTWTSSESTNTLTVFPGVAPITSTSAVESQSTSLGLSALVTLHRSDRFRLYLVPRAAWVRSTVDLDGGLAGEATVDTTTDGWLASGGFGGQVAVHDRFAIFGEAGVQYSSQQATSSLTTSRSRDETRTFGLRSAVGVTVYF